MVGRSGFLTSAGVLAIVGACICCALGILYVWGYEIEYVWYHQSRYLLAGILGLLGFAFGLTAGILALKRRMFPLVIIGMALVIVGSIFSFAEPTIGIIFGVPVLIFAVLGIIFTGISKREFV